MKTLPQIVLFCLLCMLTGQSATAQKAKPIEQFFTLKWKTNIGVTTYRTNMVHRDGKIYIGSNGIDRNMEMDSMDGVHVLDAKTGKELRCIASNLLGDNDVNGVVIYGNRMYFGSDNFQFYCYTLDGKQVWKFKTPYDVEGCPVLTNINKDSVPDVVFAVEGNGVFALDGLTGMKLWSFEEMGGYYNGSPAVFDLNDDGTEDFIIAVRGTPNSNEIDGFKMRHYGDYMVALNGMDGKILWLHEAGSGIHCSPMVVVEKDSLEIVWCEAYGGIYFLDRKGNFIKGINGAYGLFASPVVSSLSGYVTTGSSWGDGGGYSVYPIGVENFEKNAGGYLNYAWVKMTNGESMGKLSATAVSGDVIGNGKQQFIFCSETGNMSITDETGKLLQRLTFPGGAEATPMLMDIDNYGYTELLVASLDGYLYCYRTKSKMGKIRWGQFRGDERNTGVNYCK